MNIYDPKTRRWPIDLAGFYKAAADAGVTCKFNHPGTGEHYYFVEITQKDGNLLWSAPVWVTVGES